MPGYERNKDGYRFGFGGLKTNESADAMHPSKHPLAENVRSDGGQYVYTRPGYVFMFRTGTVSITSGCPIDGPELGIPYTFQFVATGGIPTYTWYVDPDTLPDGLTLDSFTGVISGTPTESGTFPIVPQVTDSSDPPQTAEIHCTLTVGEGGEFLADIMYAESSPRESNLALPTFWILDGQSQIMYRSRRAHPGSGSYGVWETMAIPSGQWIKLAGNANSNVGLTGCFGVDAKIMTKLLPPAIGGDTTDYPWTSYDISAPMHGGTPIIGPNAFWSPTLGTPVAAINDSNVVCAGESSTANATFDLWGLSTNPNPAGTWNKLWGQISNNQGDFRNALLIGTGTSFYRWYDAGYSDTGWQGFPCPSGTWVDVTAGLSDDYPFVVGIGLGAACANTTYPLESLTSFTMPSGWTGVTPRVVYDPNMYNVDMGGGNDGTYIVVGGEIAGVSVVVEIPIRNSGATLLTPIVATLPGGVPSDVKWRAVALNEIGDGVLIVGDSASEGILILSNPETTNAGTPATYDDWFLKTLAEAPF